MQQAVTDAHVLPAYSYSGIQPQTRAADFPPNYLPPAPPVAKILDGGLQLRLTTRSMRNVVLASADDSVYYECATSGEGVSEIRTVTRVQLRVGEAPRYTQVAQIQTGRVRLHEERTWWPANAILRLDALRGLGEFTADDARVYLWSVHRRTKRLQLRAADARSDSEPLAEFYAPSRLNPFTRAGGAYLQLQPGVEPILDTLILTFLMMERQRRELKF